jgi:hypothetical protein
MCRFAPGSDELRCLGDSLHSRLKAAYGGDYTRHSPCFKIQERGRHHKAMQVILEADQVDKMKDSGVFSLGRISIHLSDKRVETEILFSLGDQSSLPAFYHISGMPRCLMEDSTRGKSTLDKLFDYKLTPKGTRPKGQITLGRKKTTFEADMAAIKAKRAAGRLSSDDPSKGKDPFELYSSPGYTTPGNVPSDTISKISQRYSSIARSRSNVNMVHFHGNMPTAQSIPGRYLSPDDIGRTTSTSGGNSLSEDAEGALSEALLDPESEHVRQQMLYLLFANKGHPPPPPLPTQSPNSGDDPPLYIPAIGFENRATRQRNIQEFVSASDQYRLGFSARTKHIEGVAELEAAYVHEMAG